MGLPLYYDVLMTSTLLPFYPSLFFFSLPPLFSFTHQLFSLFLCLSSSYSSPFAPSLFSILFAFSPLSPSPASAPPIDLTASSESASCPTVTKTLSCFSTTYTDKYFYLIFLIYLLEISNSENIVAKKSFWQPGNQNFQEQYRIGSLYISVMTGSL